VKQTADFHADGREDRLVGVTSVPPDRRQEQTEAGARPAGRRFGVGKQTLFSVILVGGLLLAAEASIRVWALYFRTSYERYNAQTGRLELRPDLAHFNSYGQEFRINSRGFVGPEFDAEPAPGVYRIIALGDSCTFGTGLWQVAYPGVLQRLLDDGRSSRRFEVINAGIEGYNSTFALERIRDELLRYRPQLMVLYIGWNDLMKIDPSRQQQVDEYRWLATLLDASYLVKAYKKLLFLNLRPLVLRPATAEQPDDARAFDDFTPSRYRSNLEEMIRLLRQHDVAVLLVTLPTVVQPGMTNEELQEAQVFFPYFSDAYGVSRFLSLHRAYNKTIEDVARQERAEMLDLARTFKALPERTSFFWDTMHPSEKGHAVIAETLFSRIKQLEAAGRL
jgi:lysophospholipase L1-like esterase